MKKSVILLLVVLAVLLLAACGDSAINSSYQTAAKQLEAAGYSVTVIDTADGLSEYAAEGLKAVVLASKGGDFTTNPEDVNLEAYEIVELYYFENGDQTKTYWSTKAFQMEHQAWSDAYWGTPAKVKYHYRYKGVVAYAGTPAALELCR